MDNRAILYWVLYKRNWLVVCHPLLGVIGGLSEWVPI